jgi:thiamine-phosphate pyrophosphorylase
MSEALPLKLRGLYAITDGRRAEALLRAVASAIAGGARLVQYRDKTTDRERRQQEAGALLQMCRAARVPLIINDDISLAAAVGADGIHLGQDDAGPEEARARLGTQAIVGVTCHGRIELAEQAQQRGADYVAFGRFHVSANKAGAPQANSAVLGLARQRLQVPVVAIGGITTANGAELIAAGADMLAVIEGLFAAPDITAAARRLAALFDRA